MKTLTILAPVWVLAVCFSMSAPAADGTIHTFNHPSAGIFPLGPVIADADGNLYGTAFNGGIPPRNDNSCDETRSGCGVVFKMTPNGSGGWTYAVIYEFKGYPNDAEDPTEVLAMDAAGNLYGTTYYGIGSGDVYELSPTGTGTYTEKVLHSFSGGNGGTDGSLPTGVIVDAAGNLFGTTTYGGANNQTGTAWELSPDGSGGWTETILHSFGGGTDGKYPRTALTMDPAGNLFGTTSNGGVNGGGTVFELSPSAGGGWTESVVYSFGERGDGCNPQARVTLDASGNLYGTTAGQCEGSAYGTVFELSPSSGGYTEKIIHYFFNLNSGATPEAPVVFDSAGNLYGTTYRGGAYGYGTIFKLAPNGSGGWVESPVHNFTGNADGANPLYGVIVGPNGDIFGTTPYGGNAANSNGYGVVFEYKR